MSESTSERGVLFVDICGSTAIYETLGDAEALRVVSGSLNTLQQVVESRNGRIVKTVGDELVCAFASAEDALEAAARMQLTLSQTQTADRPRVDIRVGVHFGPVIEHDGDIFGDTVNIAARINELSNPGQVLTTWPTMQAAPPYMRSSARRLYSMSVKGRSEQVSVFEFVWRDDANLTQLSGPRTVNPTASFKLRLTARSGAVTLDEGTTSVTLGRDQENGIVVPTWTASRQHARIEHRQGKYVLRDQSSNGTFVLLEDDVEMVVRREEFVLAGRGLLGLGQSPRNAPADAIRFEID